MKSRNDFFKTGIGVGVFYYQIDKMIGREYKSSR